MLDNSVCLGKRMLSCLSDVPATVKSGISWVKRYKSVPGRRTVEMLCDSHLAMKSLKSPNKKWSFIIRFHVYRHTSTFHCLFYDKYVCSHKDFNVCAVIIFLTWNSSTQGCHRTITLIYILAWHLYLAYGQGSFFKTKSKFKLTISNIYGSVIERISRGCQPNKQSILRRRRSNKNGGQREGFAKTESIFWNRVDRLGESFE